MSKSKIFFVFPRLELSAHELQEDFFLSIAGPSVRIGEASECMLLGWRYSVLDWHVGEAPQAILAFAAWERPVGRWLD